MLIRPKRLRVGDTVGVVALSSPLPEGLEGRLNQGLAALKTMGFGVKVGKHLRGRVRHTAGTVAQRLEDLHAMFLDPEVKAVFNLRGGYNAHQLLEFIDYQLIASHPKIFMGYSDLTVLLTAFMKRAGLVTFHGPMVLRQFGEAGGPLPYTVEWLKRTLMEREAPLVVEPSDRWTDDPMTPDAHLRPSVLKRNPGPSVLRPGEASGELVGGNVGTLLMLAGTPYWPEMTGKILLVEEDEVETPETYDRYFTRLRHMGVYREIAGMLVGRAHSATAFTPQDPLEAIILEATHGCQFPVVMGLDFGHTDPMITLPLGVRAAVNTFQPPYLTLLESGVS